MYTPFFKTSLTNFHFYSFKYIFLIKQVVKNILLSIIKRETH